MTLTELLHALSDPRIRHEMVVQYGFLLGAIGWFFGGISLYHWATRDEGDE